MRLVWTTDNADQFRAFCGYLQAKSILFTTEEQVISDWSSDLYGTRKYLLWITDEDQVDACMHWLDTFIENPSSPEFAFQNAPQSSPRTTSSVTQYLEQRLKRPITTKDEEIKKEFSGPIRLTACIILICSLLFLYELYNSKRTQAGPGEVRQELLGLSPVRKALLFDYPNSYELLDKIALLYGPNALAKPQELPEAGKFLYSEFLREPIFSGYYPYILAFTQKELGQTPEKTPPASDFTLFEKIRSGEVWRLFSPALLHIDILHLFFNMIWVMLLGTQIEARVGSVRLLALVLISGVFSNVGQYLMSGPNFAGFSGAICCRALINVAMAADSTLGGLPDVFKHVCLYHVLHRCACILIYGYLLFKSIPRCLFAICNCQYRSPCGSHYRVLSWQDAFLFLATSQVNDIKVSFVYVSKN